MHGVVCECVCSANANLRARQLRYNFLPRESRDGAAASFSFFLQCCRSRRAKSRNSRTMFPFSPYILFLLFSYFNFVLRNAVTGRLERALFHLPCFTRSSSAVSRFVPSVEDARRYAFAMRALAGGSYPFLEIRSCAR